MVRSDGRPVSESVADRYLTTPEILAQAERRLAWAERGMTHDAADSAHARMFTPSPNARDLWALPEEIDEAARRRRRPSTPSSMTRG